MLLCAIIANYDQTAADASVVVQERSFCEITFLMCAAIAEFKPSTTGVKENTLNFTPGNHQTERLLRNTPAPT